MNTRLILLLASFLFPTIGFSQSHHFLNIEVVDLLRADLHLSYSLLKKQKLSYDFGIKYGNVPQFIFMSTGQSTGVIGRSERYHSPALSFLFDLTIHRDSMVDVGKGFFIGAGLEVNFRLNTEEAYAIDYKEKYQDNPYKGEPWERGLEDYGARFFLGYEYKLFRSFWINLSVHLGSFVSTAKEGRSLLYEGRLIPRIRLTYQFGSR